MSDEEEIDEADEKESVVASTSEFDIQNDQLSDRLDIDLVLEDELKRLNVSLDLMFFKKI